MYDIKTCIEKENDSSFSSNTTPVARKRERFEDKYQRITTYIRKDLHSEIQTLKRDGKIDSITELLNDSIERYLGCL